MGKRADKSGFRYGIALVVIGLLVSNLAVASAQESPTTTTSSDDAALTEAQLQDLSVMAKQYDITLDEAISRYAWHEPFSFMVNEIREKFPEDFAGARIEGHSAEQAWVAFKASVPSDALRTISEFSKDVKVHEDRQFTERDLDEQLVRTQRVLVGAQGAHRGIVVWL